ncbi:MAG: PSD1 and planctomycete cytochrome C domain-containing protein [Armatimonadaceae bacterium]
MAQRRTPAWTGADSKAATANAWKRNLLFWGLGCGVMLLASLPPATGQGPAKNKVPAEAAEFFESKVRPVLLENCISCHGKDAQIAGLRLDSREALLKGGESGPALVPGNPDKSLLIEVIRHTGKIKMPQGGKLKDTEIANLTAWVQAGAPWPESAGAGTWSMSSGQKHWSFQPVAKPKVPQVKNKLRVANPIDAFVLAKLEAKGLTPAPLADRRTLLRRVTYDLTGLPPTYEEMQAFLADKSPDAYEKVVDRLLASPRYGERWARHWLDVARYSDTKGYVFNEDRNYYNAYTYREWVIGALNRDLPYDRFVMQQIAADLLPEVQNGEDKQPLAALGFLTIGRRFINNPHDIIDDRIDVTMRGFQAMTVSCARCHDHKFDPVPTKDYYALYAVFNNSVESSPPISPRAISEPYMQHEEKVRAADNRIRTIIETQTKRLRGMVKNPEQAKTLSDAVKKALQSVREHELPNGKNLEALEPAFEPDERRALQETRQRVEELRKTYPPKPEFAMALADKPQDQCGDGRVFKRGNPGNPGDVAPRAFLTVLRSTDEQNWKQGSGRLQLARAIASEQNPLTARVLVNRVWMHHFGGALVRTPSDFGRQGEKPTHPELLDWLAATFMEDGWSLKRLHKRIVLSATYRQSSVTTEKLATLDPENRLWARANRRRLDMEQMRDSLLKASGKIDLSEVGGKSVEIWEEPFNGRRTVYGFVERQNLPQVFKTFDFASPDTHSPQRFFTTVPQQALFLMNNSFAISQARALAALPQIAGATDEGQRVRRMYLRLFNRLPDKNEEALGVAFLKQPNEETPMRTATWQYGYGFFDPATRQVTFTELPHFSRKDGNWRIREQFPDARLGYIMLSAEGGHPGNDGSHGVIRRWTAPRPLTLRIGGKLKHGNKEGDGVRARLVSNKQGLIAEWTAHNGEAQTSVAKVTVEAGEVLDFVVDPISGPAFDSFSWSPVLTDAGAGKTTPRAVTVWNARRDFAGPMPPPLTRREQYVQALLMTNEFLFVD